MHVHVSPRDRKNARQREAYWANLEEARRVGREKRRRLREKDREKANLLQKAYRARDPGKWRTYSRDHQRKRRLANPHKVKAEKKNNNLRNFYGLTLEQRNALLAAQGWACAGCNTTDPGPQDWNVDHCHTTGKIRGVLCHRCNKALGFVRDKPNTLRALASYLESNK